MRAPSSRHARSSSRTRSPARSGSGRRRDHDARPVAAPHLVARRRRAACAEALPAGVVVRRLGGELGGARVDGLVGPRARERPSGSAASCAARAGTRGRSSCGARLRRVGTGAECGEQDVVLWSERGRQIAAAVDQLPERQRTVFTLCQMAEQSTHEVSQALGLSEATVRVHLFRAVRKLRRLLEREWMMKADNHLSDDQLIELCLGGGPLAAPGCPSLRSAPGGSGGAAARSVRRGRSRSGCSLPGERLARQQARILHRLEQDGRPGRLIAFPGQPRSPRRCASRPATRWIAGRGGRRRSSSACSPDTWLHDMPGTAAFQPRTSACDRWPAAGGRCAPSRRRSPRTSSSARSRWRRTAPARGRRCARCTT